MTRKKQKCSNCGKKVKVVEWREIALCPECGHTISITGGWFA